MGHDATREEVLAAVERLSPLIREHADRGERERHLMDPVVEALRDAGLYRMLVPRHLGGLQVEPLTFYHVVEALSRVPARRCRGRDLQPAAATPTASNHSETGAGTATSGSARAMPERPSASLRTAPNATVPSSSKSGEPKLLSGPHAGPTIALPTSGSFLQASRAAPGGSRNFE
jgi:Acyl-CoA dehydrogenase, N-terminal domain